MTRRFCVIGHPIAHSMSPVMHNAVFQKLGVDCSYTLFDVPPADLGNWVRRAVDEGFGGCNVTIPHKVAVISHLDSLSQEARVIGAVNTIKFGKRLEGFNTDGIGALEALKKNGADPEGKRVLILGSGGAARAISVTLALRGNAKAMSIIGIVGDEVSRLVGGIKKSTKCRVKGMQLDDKTLKDSIEEADILIHATPVGMHPKSEDALVTAEQLKPELAVMDIVYNPLETRLMREARMAGVQTIISGVDMFVNQGAEALRIWLGIEPPVEFMKEAVIEELSKKSE